MIGPPWNLLIALGGLALLLLTSGRLVWAVLESVKSQNPQQAREEGEGQADPLTRSTGVVIGKCENILIFLFVLFDQYTALALVFTAKTIVRREDIQRDTLFFLAGTLVNVTYSLLLAILTRLGLAKGDLSLLFPGS